LRKAIIGEKGVNSLAWLESRPSIYAGSLARRLTKKKSKSFC